MWAQWVCSRERRIALYKQCLRTCLSLSVWCVCLLGVCQSVLPVYFLQSVCCQSVCLSIPHSLFSLFACLRGQSLSNQVCLLVHLPQFVHQSVDHCVYACLCLSIYCQSVQSICVPACLYQSTLSVCPVYCSVCLLVLYCQSVQSVCLSVLYCQSVQSMCLPVLYCQSVQSVCLPVLHCQTVQSMCLPACAGKGGWVWDARGVGRYVHMCKSVLFEHAYRVQFIGKSILASCNVY